MFVVDAVIAPFFKQSLACNALLLAFKRWIFEFLNLENSFKSGAVTKASGSVLVEFAISLPILIIVAGGIIDLGFALKENEAVTDVTRMIGRLVAETPRIPSPVVLGSPGDPSEADDFCTTQLTRLSGFSVSKIPVTEYSISVELLQLGPDVCFYDSVRVAVTAPNRRFNYFSTALFPSGYTSTFALINPISRDCNSVGIPSTYKPAPNPLCPRPSSGGSGGSSS